MGYSLELERRQTWVMTINKTFSEVTMWDPKAHKNWVLKHRINKEERKYLHNYLCPNLEPEDIRKIFEIREAQKKSLASLDEDAKDDYDPWGGLEK